jgi:hypothetical protein
LAGVVDGRASRDAACHAGAGGSGFPVPARPTLSVEKLLFSVTLLRGTFSSTAIEIVKWVKNFAVAKVC